MKSIATLAFGVLLGVSVMLFVPHGSSQVVHAGSPSGNGDVNGDGRIDIADGIYIINYLLRDGPAPDAIVCAACDSCCPEPPGCDSCCPPAPPLDLLCQHAGATVTLTWSNPIPYHGLVLKKNGALLAELAGTDATYTDSDVAPGIPYSYALHGVLEGKASATTTWTITLCAECPPCDSCCPLAAPLDLRCEQVGLTVTLTWSSPVRYNHLTLERDGALIARLVGSETSYTDDKVTQGSTYAYALSGILAGSTSPSVSCAITLATECPPYSIMIMLPGNVPLEMVPCHAAIFMMGRYFNEQDSTEAEDARHQVRVTGDFYLGKYEITKQQWLAVMGTAPWREVDGRLKPHVLDDPDTPAVYINWYEAQEFVAAMNALGQGTFSLPTEAQWEYACRARTTTRFFWGDDPDYAQIGRYAWYYPNAWGAGEQYAHVVGQKLPNAWGLHDMSGNVWEWCQDWYKYGYSEEAVIDPAGPYSGTLRVNRGGAFLDSAEFCRSARRNGTDPVVAYHYVGLRIAKRAE